MERVDELECKNLKIIQDDDLYCFTIDPILLVNLSKVKPNSVVVDLCSGCGVIPILVAGKSNAQKVFGVELQTELCNLANKSIKMNKQTDVVSFINDDIKNCPKYFKSNSIDVVYCNPPYGKAKSAIIGENNSRMLARHEIAITLEEVIKVASDLLKFGGVFYMVHQAKRLQEILCCMQKYALAVKEITICQSKTNEKPHLIIIKATKNGKCGTIVNKPLVINNDDGTLTDEVKSLYSKLVI